MDRYSNWPIIKKTSHAAGLIKCLREEFVCQSNSQVMVDQNLWHQRQSFLKAWGVYHRISSVAFPHSNCRAEVGVKTCKRLIMNNTGPNGELEVAKYQGAVLQYRNTPDQDTKMSPAMIVFGRCVRDLIPVLPGKYTPQQAWTDNAGLRESALRKRHLPAVERLTAHTKRLPPLQVGDHVRIPNQFGSESLTWDKTGIVVEVKQHDQYVIRVDGSGRVTLRNRKFLRRFSLYEPSIHCPVPVTYQHAREPSKGPTRSYTTPKLRHPSPQPRPTEPAISSTPRPISTGSSEPTVSPRCQSPTTPIVLNPPLVELQPSGDTTFAETPAPISRTSDQAPSTAPPSFTPRRSKRVTRPTKRYIEQCDNVYTRSSAGNL